MGQDETLGAYLGQMLFQGLQAEMILDDLLVHVGFGDEKVGAMRQRNERFRPFGIAGIGDNAAFGLDPEPEKRTAGIAVHDGVGGHLHAAKTAALFRDERDD